MAKTLDMKALIAHLTDTSIKDWDVYMGLTESYGIEENFIEIGDFGPWDEDVADMIRDGYTSGQRWSLTTDIDLDDNDAAAHEIARLVGEGYTSGIEPSWSVEIDTVEPRKVYVQIIDEEVNVSMEAVGDHPAIEFYASFDELQSSAVTAGFVTEEPENKI